MTVTEISDNLPTRPAPAPTRISQGTAVEQSRAMAQVHAQVMVAKQNPRNIGAASDELRLACSTKAVAERAFWRYKRGGQQLNGITVQLAREMARCFRNVDYGIVELHRDDAEGMSEMMAMAWDLENNTRSTTTFFVPHRRYMGGDPLSDLRDIYENNASQGGRRVREMILAILPPWFIEAGEAACYATLEKGDKSIEDRRAEAIAVYADLGVTESMLIQKLNRPVDAWVPADLAQLTIVHRSLKRHETTIEDEFPAALVTVEDLAAQSAGDASASDSPPTAEDTAPAPTTPPDEPPELGDTETAAQEPKKAAPTITTVKQLQKLYRGAGIPIGKVIKAAAEMEHAARSLDEIVADADCLADVVDWIEQHRRTGKSE